MGWKVKSANLAQPENQIVCSLCKVPTVFIEPLPKYKIEKLLDTYPHKEWAGYLVGRTSEQGNIFVEDISIPPHRPGSVTSGSAEVDRPDYNKTTGKYDFHIPENCVGFIHSHDSLGAFHSGTDDAHVDRNYPVSVTVAKRSGSTALEYDTVFFGVTPCGKATLGKAVVKYVAPKPEYDIEAWLKEAKANIEKEDKVYYPPVTVGRTYASDYWNDPLYWEEKLRPNKRNFSYSPPRDDKGHFLPRLDKQLQKMSKQGSTDDIVVDASGHVLSQKELEDFLESQGGR